MPEMISQAFWTAFWSALWLTLGIVAGSLIQYRLGQRVLQEQRRMALRVLLTEIELNLGELNAVYERIRYLRERIAANQIEEGYIFLSFASFDYSAVSPLVGTGHFHTMLTPREIKSYASFMRFFTEANARLINSALQTDHARGKSLDYLAQLENHVRELEANVRAVHESVKQAVQKRSAGFWSRLIRRKVEVA